MSDQGPSDTREVRVECPFCRGAGKVDRDAECATGGILSDHRARVAALEAERDALRERLAALEAVAKRLAETMLAAEEKDSDWFWRDEVKVDIDAALAEGRGEVEG